MPRHAGPALAPLGRTLARRAFLHGAVRIAGGIAVAGVAASGRGATGSTPAIPAPVDKRVKAAGIRWAGDAGRVLHGYMALPAKARGRQPAVLIVHDAAGLTEPVRAVARRVALAGYIACAPDFLAGSGGTPADAAAARIMTGMLDPARLLADALATVRWLGGNRYATGKVAALGLGWGGALVERIAGAADGALTAGIVSGGLFPGAAGSGTSMLVLPDALDGDGPADAPAWTRVDTFLKEHLR